MQRGRLLLVPRRASDSVGSGRRRTTRWPADGSRLSNAGGEGSPTLSSSTARVRHGDDGATERWTDGKEATTHPYLVHQMLDFGFRQTLEVRTLGCARRSLPYRSTSDPLMRTKMKNDEQHKRHEVYTGSGHRCGVIPYSSVWCGGLPQGADDEQYKGRIASREVFLSWCDELLG